MFTKPEDNDCDKYSNQIKCISFQAEPINLNTGYNSNLQYQNLIQPIYNQSGFTDKVRSIIENNPWGGSVSQYGDDDVKISVTNAISQNLTLGAYGTKGGEVGATLQYRFE